MASMLLVVGPHKPSSEVLMARMLTGCFKLVGLSRAIRESPCSLQAWNQSKLIITRVSVS